MAALALVLAAAIAALALRGRRRLGLAETVLAGFTIFSFVVALIMFGLASFGGVSRSSVSVATWAIAGMLALAASGGRRAHLVRRCASALRSLAASLGSRARRERPLFHVALLVLGALFSYSVLQAWLFPSDSWDGIWYHDTITGWVIQTGGTGPIPLPSNLLQQANGFPKLAELTSAWWCLTVGREAAEFSNLIGVPAFGAATYLLARRWASRDVAMGVACVVLLVPGSVLQWRTTYVDVLVAAFGASALHYAGKATRARLDDALFATTLGLAVATKWNVLTLAPALVVVWLVASSPRRSWQDWAMSTLVVAAPALAFALTALPNVANFGNPVWPVAVSLPRLGIAWPGVHASAHVNVNASTAETAAAILLPTPPGRDFADIRKGGYGLAFPWLLAPLAVVSLALLARRATSGGSSDPRAVSVRRARFFRAASILGPIVPFVGTSPAVWSARYSLIAVAAVASVSMACARARGPAFGTWARRGACALIGAALCLSLHRLSTFAPPLGGASVAETWAAVARPASERGAPASWTIAPEVAAARDVELGPGALVIFGDEVAFPSVLYGPRFENRVSYVGGAGPFDEAIDRLQPTWIVASDEEPLGVWVRARADRWEPIGLASRGLPTTAYRRRTAR